MRIWKALLHCFALSVCLGVKVDLATSSATPFNLTQISQFLLPVDSVKSLEDTNLFSTAWAPVVLDYTYSPALSLLLLEAASDSLIIGMYEDCPEQELRSQLSPEDLSVSVGKALTILPFSNVFMIRNARNHLQLLAAGLNTAVQTIITSTVILHPEMDLPSAVNIVGRVVKPAGTNLGLLLLDEITGGNVIMALQEYELLGVGFAYVSLQVSVWGVMASGKADGLLFVGDEELATARSREEFETGLLRSQLEALEKAAMQGADSTEAIRSFLVAAYQGKSRNATACIVNIQHGLPRIVPSSSMLFPGNSTSFPKNSQATLQVSVNSLPNEYDGSVFPLITIINRGFHVGYAEVNNRSDILPTFQIHVNSVGYGAVAFKTDWAITQIQKNPKAVGLAHHPLALSQNIIGVTTAFQRLGMEVPVVTPSGASKLSNPTAYPLYLRTRASTVYAAFTMVRFFNLFGWKKVAIVTSTTEEDKELTEAFRNVSRSSHINITNVNQLLPNSLLDADAKLNQTVTEILTSNTRIVIISHTKFTEILARMYDLGARSGDYLVILAYGISYTFFAGEGEDFRKRRVVAKGAMSFVPKFFGGEVGKRVQNALIAIDKANYYPNGCSYYDSALLVSHALDYMLANGQHYERARELMDAMRNTRFVGCIGRVQIEQGTNDNVAGDMTISNLQYDEVNDTFKITTAAVYSPNKVQMFNITPDLQWPNGLTSFPDSWEEDEDCPYFIKDIIDFPKGQTVGLVACFIFSGVTGVVTILIWRKWWRVVPTPLIEPQSISIEDVLVLVSIPIDFLQFAAVAPALGLTSFLSNLFNSTSLNIEALVSFTHGVFWGIEAAVFVMVLLYVLIFGIKLWAIDEKLRKWDCCSFVAYWADLLLPTFGNVMFLPIISTLLSTFNCYRAVGESFTDSFLNRDCEEKCWSGKHLYFASFAAICLVAYTPIAVFTRPLWQDLQSNLHLKALPLYLMLKSVLQIFLISASSTLKFAHQTAHAAAYFSIISLYVCFLARYEAFNYARASMWHFLVIAAVWLYGLVGLLHWCFEGISSSTWVIVLAACYSAFAIVGLLFQTFRRKYRSLLKREKGPDRSDIIKFGFTFGNLASFHLSNFLAKTRVQTTKEQTTSFTFQK